jgi:hypothetical protein
MEVDLVHPCPCPIMCLKSAEKSVDREGVSTPDSPLCGWLLNSLHTRQLVVLMVFYDFLSKGIRVLLNPRTKSMQASERQELEELSCILLQSAVTALLPVDSGIPCSQALLFSWLKSMSFLPTCHRGLLHYRGHSPTPCPTLLWSGNPSQIKYS